MERLLYAFRPDFKNVISRRNALMIIFVLLGIFVTYWTLFKPVIFPSPLEVVQAFPRLWMDNGLGEQLFNSLLVNAEALFYSSLISVGLAYLGEIPIVRYIVLGISKLRFVSPATFLFVFIMAAHNGHQVKVWMLTLGITVFFITTMAGVVASVPEEEYDDARTLRMGSGKMTWYVVIRGTLDQAFDALRDNAAMGWAMLTMVEGVVRSEGGVGVMIVDQTRYLNLADVYAIACTIILTGIGQDYLIGTVKKLVCPYADLEIGRQS